MNKKKVFPQLNLIQNLPLYSLGFRYLAMESTMSSREHISSVSYWVAFSLYVRTEHRILASWTVGSSVIADRAAVFPGAGTLSPTFGDDFDRKLSKIVSLSDNRTKKTAKKPQTRRMMMTLTTQRTQK